MASNTPHNTKDDNQPVASTEHEVGSTNSNNAVDFIRDKVDRIYSGEPNVSEEIIESKLIQQRSKHQQFMYDLSASGKDLATIQTEWHTYYQNLNANDKHQVWQEFYASQSQLTGQRYATSPSNEAQSLAENKHRVKRAPRTKPPKLRDARTSQDIKHAIRHNVTAGGKLEVKHQLQSLLFGLGIGLIVIFIFMFGFFNEVFIAPFIQPSRVQADTPLIVSSSSISPTPNPEVIIPKINVEIPIIYNETSTNEATIENDLQDGVVHYPTTVLPGKNGNTAYFGHSSNNIFNQGKYKFAFVLLHTLVNGDTFYLTNNNKIYVYKVISHTIVKPNDVGVLGPVSGQTATATLITCDPPGTSINRLVVVGQQISPDPTGNTQAEPVSTTTTTLPTQLPGNGKTLLGHFISTAAGKLLVAAVAIASVAVMVRVFYKKTTQFLK